MLVETMNRTEVNGSEFITHFEEVHCSGLLCNNAGCVLGSYI